MIKKIKIQNFQRIDEELCLQLGAVTVLVGENGCGKSSFMKGVHWAVRCATLADGGKVTLDQMDFVPSKDFLDLAHKLKLQNSSTGRKITVTLVDEDDNDTTISISAARNSAGVNVSLSGPLRDVLTNNDKPSTSFIPGIAGAAEEETILSVPILHRKAASGEGGSVLRQIILANAVGNDGTGPNYAALDDLSYWVSEVLPETRFWVKFDRLRDRNIDVKFLTPEMRVAGQSHSVGWKSIDMAGTGFLQVVQIFAYLLYFKPKLLLIDEPDAHLHPGRQQLLIKALEKASKAFPETQIVLTTHSPSLVRALSTGAVIHWLDNGALRANGNVVRERMGWSALDKELLIFSEDGNTEYLQSLLDQWPTLAQKCAIWPTFGNDSLPNGQKSVGIAKKMGIKVLIHRDRDFMSDDDLAEWSQKKCYPQNGISVWFPDGADIESMFCNIHHIAAALDVPVPVANEIFDAALSRIDPNEAMLKFSNAYGDAVNKLPSTVERNPIARWSAMGGYNASTIKGKYLLDALLKECLNVLPNHGFAQRMGQRVKIKAACAGFEVATSLRDKVAEVIG